MEKIQDQIQDLCKLADKVVANPSVEIVTTAAKIGVGASITSFIAGGALVLSPLLGPAIPVITIATWVTKKVMKNNREQQEKERMLREVIGKQQAVIDRLNQELAKSRQQNEKNHREIENLKEMLRMLEEAESQLKAA